MAADARLSFARGVPAASARGKAAKVALVACMRKLLVILNARMRDALREEHAIA